MRTSIILVLLFALCTGTAIAAEGADSDASLKNALRAAVQQAVGTMIDAKTMVENDEVISDKILSHSGGYVVKYDVIGEPKSEGGLVTTRIQAVVKSNELRQTLESEKVITVAFDGKDVSAEMFTIRLQTESAAEILPSLFEGFPGDFISVKMEGEPEVDKEKNKFIVPVRVDLDVAKTKAFIKRVDEFFKTASKEKAVTSRATVDTRKNRFYLSNLPNASKHIFLMTSLNSARTNAIVKSYPIDADMFSFFNTAFEKIPYMSIDLVDSDGEPIMGKNLHIPKPFTITPYHDRVAIFPVLNIINGVSDTFDPGKESAVYYIDFDVSPDEVAAIKNVKMEVMID